MENEERRVYYGAVNPADYPHERLVRERIALLRCVADEPVRNTFGPGKVPEIGKHYLAMSSFHKNFFAFDPDHPVFEMSVLDTSGHNRCAFPYEDFEIVDDPYNVTERRQGLSWFYYNRNQWLRTRLANRDHSQDMVSEEYLRENNLALVQFLGSPCGDRPLTIGDQFFALTHEPDFTPASDYIILEELRDGSKAAVKECAAYFEILADPLHLLDPAETEYETNIELQRASHPEWFPKKSSQKSLAVPVNV